MAESKGSTPATSKKSSKKTKTGKRKKRDGRRKDNGADRQNQRGKKRTYPTINERLEVDHVITQAAFDKMYDVFRSAFFHTTSILGSFGMEDGANEVHEYIVSVIDGAKQEIDAETARIAAKIRKKGGPDVIPRSSPRKATRTAEVPAYVVRRYLTLFPAVDRLIDAIVCAENHGAISWTQRSKLLKEAPRYLRSPAGRFQSLATKLNSRQKREENSLDNARAAIKEVLGTALAQHRELPGIEEKRPLADEKTGTTG